MDISLVRHGLLDLRFTHSFASEPKPYLEIIEWSDKHKFCYTIAILDWPSDEGPDLRFIGNRPFTCNSGFAAFNSFILEVVPPMYEYYTFKRFMQSRYPEALI